MTKCGFAFVFIISISTLMACAPQDGHHSHNDQRPTAGETTTVLPSGQVVTVTPEDPRAKRDLEIKQHLFDFMTSLKPLIVATYTPVIYNQDEPIEIFVGHRCESLIKKMALAPKGPNNLYDKLVVDALNITHKDLATAACDDPTTHFVVIPGKLISRSYSERNIISPDVDESVNITLRPDNTVAGYNISEGVTKDNRSATAFILNESVVSQFSENDYHEVFSALNSHYEKITIDGVDGSFSYQQEDIPYTRQVAGQGEGTLKKLQLKSFESAYDLKAEEFVTASRTPLIGPKYVKIPPEATCTINLFKPGSDVAVNRVERRAQCFPEYRY